MIVSPSPEAAVRDALAGPHGDLARALAARALRSGLPLRVRGACRFAGGKGTVLALCHQGGALLGVAARSDGAGKRVRAWCGTVVWPAAVPEPWLAQTALGALALGEAGDRNWLPERATATAAEVFEWWWQKGLGTAGSYDWLGKQFLVGKWEVLSVLTSALAGATVMSWNKKVSVLPVHVRSQFQEAAGLCPTALDLCLAFSRVIERCHAPAAFDRLLAFRGLIAELLR
jgi:hypothetical protein